MVTFSGIGAQQNYAVRGKVVQMQLNAVDQYNLQVRKMHAIKKYGDGELQEAGPIARAQALVMVNRMSGGFSQLKQNNLRIVIPKEEFTDIPKRAEAGLAPTTNQDPR